MQICCAAMATAKTSKIKKPASKTPKTAAAGAATHLDRAAQTADAALCLREIVAAYGAQPSPKIADALNAAARVAGSDRPAISGVDHAERDKAWLAVEKSKDPVDLDRLLSTLVETRCEQAVERMERLEKWPVDPRFLEQLVRYIEADPTQRRGESSPVPFTSQTNRKFWISLLRIVESRADASHIARFKKVIGRKTSTNFESWLAQKLEKICTKIEPRVEVPLPDDVAEALDRLDAALRQATTVAKVTEDTADALYLAVWKNPDDDAPRVVLADFLSQRGDPRGEFITLQLAAAAGTLDKAGRAREKELLKRHKKQWVGPIAPLIQTHWHRFERGFLVTCSIEPNEALEAELGTHPAWSTIREFFVQWYAKKTGKKLIAHLESLGAVEVTNLSNRGAG